MLDGGWKVAPVKAVDPVTNIHPLEAPAYVRLEPTDETARRQLSVRVTGRRPVPSPTAVADVTKWRGRRAELRALFEREVYGFRPAERPDALRFEPAEPDCVMMDGQAVRKRIRASWKGPHADYDFTFTAFVPNRPGPHPSFLLICNRDPKENIDPTRRRKSDFWAGQLGQYYAARLVSPMWEAMGAKGLEPKTLPVVIGGAPVSGTCLQEGSISFHCRPGGHNLTSYDWARYMDFADRHGWLK